ncbi:MULTISPECIES: H-NS family nucleoid-associated regulatory protein [Rubrivivax]|uniref:H-NS histone family protein n=1 Tax=Rubrivivax benzoatilyticus TaxID=316997 RepID=A0ABX0HTI3_9BURK|nr:MULTISPECIES: H-NS histone family protein [Rubrivivax]MCD0416476.1 H-NS histone family protein [Rubrivivax sp. JA1024]EGJ08952.1 nucleoid protein H-NS [Rubrivivax benzoatilyticus JA2 = ATCC BAA-35]MCC9597562.1 H-NS histone family protein [Rubrivivax sp. JA1055]MCC9646180.1 H-NS histone family protein [Rubrivivax sp. JA1029]NHK98324.1 H-NS histone family protein [Rubrivivax benzoatilyticus]
MATLSELLAQKAALEKQIIETQREERAAAIAQVKSLMSQYGLTLADLSGKTSAAAPRRGSTGKVPAKFRDPDTGDTWSGRGLQPKWLKAALANGRSLSDFAV